MNKSKLSLTFMVLFISTLLTIITVYFFGWWAHGRYWDGTIVRVNQIEASVYNKLLKTNISEILLKKDFDVLNDIFEPLNGKLLIRIIDKNEKIIFQNLSGSRKLRTILEETHFNLGSDQFTFQIISYQAPFWAPEYLGWFTDYKQWFLLKYDRITIPFIFFFCIWSLVIIALIWRYKAHLENDRLFHVLREFEENS